MKYYAQIGDHEYEIVIEQEQILIDGEPVRVDLQQSGVPELYSVLFDGSSYELLIEAARQNYTITLHGEQIHVQIEDERSRKLNTGRKIPAATHGELSIMAPIPGLVVQILVEEGESIEENQPLLILEAMKMENEIRAQRAGTVKDIRITAGQRVEQNSLLLVIE